MQVKLRKMDLLFHAAKHARGDSQTFAEESTESLSLSVLRSASPQMAEVVVGGS